MSNPVVGNIIQSFDFVCNVDNYMIGKVIAIYDDVLHCECISQVIEGVVSEIYSPVFNTPMQGSCLLDDIFERVVVLG